MADIGNGIGMNPWLGIGIGMNVGYRNELRILVSVLVLVWIVSMVSVSVLVSGYWWSNFPFHLCHPPGYQASGLLPLWADR